MRTLRRLAVCYVDINYVGAQPRGSTIFMTPAMWTVYHGHVELMQLLLDAGADASAADEHGKTLLEMSQEARQPEIEAMIRARLKATT